jgi:hypothetical protein
MLAELIDRFEEIFAAGTPPQRKALIQRVVKAVEVRDKETAEVEYGVPVRDPAVRTTVALACLVTQCTNPKVARTWPEVRFRLVLGLNVASRSLDLRGSPARPSESSHQNGLPPYRLSSDRHPD